jgi:hypothetical protein
LDEAGEGHEHAVAVRRFRHSPAGLVDGGSVSYTEQLMRHDIRFHEWIGDAWAVLLSRPKDFTPACTTELGTMAGLKGEFDKRNVRINGIRSPPSKITTSGRATKEAFVMRLTVNPRRFSEDQNPMKGLDWPAVPGHFGKP